MLYSFECTLPGLTFTRSGKAIKLRKSFGLTFYIERSDCGDVTVPVGVKELSSISKWQALSRSCASCDVPSHPKMPRPGSYRVSNHLFHVAVCEIASGTMAKWRTAHGVRVTTRQSASQQSSHQTSLRFGPWPNMDEAEKPACGSSPFAITSTPTTQRLSATTTKIPSDCRKLLNTVRCT